MNKYIIVYFLIDKRGEKSVQALTMLCKTFTDVELILKRDNAMLNRNIEILQITKIG